MKVEHWRRFIVDELTWEYSGKPHEIDEFYVPAIRIAVNSKTAYRRIRPYEDEELEDVENGYPGPKKVAEFEIEETQEIKHALATILLYLDAKVAFERDKNKFNMACQNALGIKELDIQTEPHLVAQNWDEIQTVGLGVEC